MILDYEREYIGNAARWMLDNEKKTISAEQTILQHIKTHGSATHKGAEKLRHIIRLRKDIIINLGVIIEIIRIYDDEALTVEIQTMNSIYQRNKQQITRLYGPSGIHIKPANFAG